MSDGWVDVATDCCQTDFGPVRWSKVCVKLMIAYAILAALYWTETKFRRQSVEVAAKIEVVGQVPKNGVLVRYHFRDPETGLPRMNTERLPAHRVPQSSMAIVEVISGEYPSSRLQASARPAVIGIFFWVNVVFFLSAAALVGYLVWEANHPLTRKKRYRIPYHPDSSPKRWRISAD